MKRQSIAKSLQRHTREQGPEGTNRVVIQMESKLLRLTKEVYFNRSNVMLLIATGLSALLLLIAFRRPNANEREILIAIATGMFAATVFTFLQIMFTSLRYEALVAQSIEDAIESATRRVLEESAAQQREFLPLHVYPAAMRPDRRFNQDLTTDLRSTRRFLFRGVTGRYTMARLWLENRAFDEVHILVANPKNLRVIESRVTHIVSYTEPGSSYQEVEKRLVEEIYETVVAARLASAKCRSLTVHLLNEPQVDRVELFDGALYLTLYSDSTEKGTRFPRTLRLGPTSILYKIYSSQLSQSIDSAAESLILKPSTSDDELVRLLTNLGNTACTVEIVRGYEVNFKAFARQFGNDVS